MRVPTATFAGMGWVLPSDHWTAMGGPHAPHCEHLDERTPGPVPAFGAGAVVTRLDDPFAAGDWQSFLAARDRFFAAVRPEAMGQAPRSPRPDAPSLERPANTAPRDEDD